MYLNNKHKISPYIHGGSQERNMRGGTENVYGIIGLAEALKISCDDILSIKSLNILGLDKIGIMSLNSIPFFGKSGKLLI